MENKNKFIKYFIHGIPLLFLCIIYLRWFILPEIHGGDWPYYAKGMFSTFSILAPLWTTQGGIGLGGANADFPIFSYEYFTIGLFVNMLHFPWNIVYKALWFGFPLILASISMAFLYKSVKRESSFWEICLSIFLYLSNTYFIMIAAGGQMGIVLAYAAAPLVVGLAIRSVSRFNYLSKLIIKSGLLFGLSLGMEMLFDPRITYLTLGIILIYFVYYYIFVRKYTIFIFITYLGIAFATLGLLHSYWLVPFYFFKLLSIPTGVTSGSGFAFFSFADFSHAFAFLHPNWPDNIFGKVYFLQPEFLIYPILAFSGLLFLKRSQKERSQYLFFALLSLIGVFFAKGVNGPFGQVNIWFFHHMPGFNLFRDPTKFYLFISLSYSIMIPVSIKIIYDQRHKNVLERYAIFMILSVFLLFPIRQALLGKLGGTFADTSVPEDYIRLSASFSSQPEFFRSLWVPTPSRFRFSAEEHPVLNASDIFQTSSTSGVIKKLQNMNEKKYLQDITVKYIIIPYDSTSEIFLTDRKYDDKKRQDLERKMDTISWLKKIQFGKIVLYEVPNYKDHFWLTSGTQVKYQKNSIDSYNIAMNASSPKTLVFSESYHPGWEGFISGKKINSIKTKEGLNSFMLPAGKYTLNLSFTPQQYQKYFYTISIGSLLIIVLFLIFM